MSSSADHVTTGTVMRVRNRLARIAGRLARRADFAISMLVRPRRTARMLRDESLEISFPHYRRSAVRVVQRSLLAVAAVGVVLGGAIVTGTSWLVLSASLALLGLLVLAIVHRRHHGSRSLMRRGLPPGELTRLACPLLDVNHHAEFAATHGPVFTTNHLHTPLVAVYGLERGHEVLHRCAADLAPMPRPDNDLVEGGFVRTLEGDAHRRMRTTLAPSFGVTVVERLRDRMERSIDEEISTWGTDRRGELGVHSRPLVEHLVLSVWLNVFFGASRTHHPERFTRLFDLYRQIDHLYPTPEMRTVQDHIVEEVRALGHTADLEDCVLRDLLSRSPVSLDDTAVIENLVHLVTSSHADMTGLFDWMIKFMADNPASAAQLRTCADDDVRTQAGAFVSEALRLAQSEVLLRYTKRPAAIGGYAIPARWMVRVLVRESHRDPEVFDDPLEFRPDRFISRTYGRFEYSPFGLDGRSCIGESFARTSASIFAVLLARSFVIEVLEDGPLQLSVHRHAAPNSHWRVNFRPVDSNVKVAPVIKPAELRFRSSR
jgi:cytochrome P450